MSEKHEEYPDSAPYEFEGFREPSDDLIFALARDPAPTDRDTRNVLVLRAGANNHGTWSYTYVWEAGQWAHKGYGLEPRPNVGKGPIPLGEYNFVRWMSPKLGKTLRLANVPGFTDILIHVGNFQHETQGCILVALRVDNLKQPTQLIDSRKLTDWLYDNCSDGIVKVRSS